MKIKFTKNLIFSVISTLFFSTSLALASPPIKVGSKIFTESYILAEIGAEMAEKTHPVDRKFGLGATGILFQALISGAVDFYPEYTGTIAEAILKNPSLRDWDSITEELKKRGLIMSHSLGFNNTYALAIRSDYAQANGIHNISDLARFPKIKMGLSHEFMERSDGFPGLINRYHLKLENISSIEHSLAYLAIQTGEITVTDVYSTDAKIEKLKLLTLTDDLNYFPVYESVWLAKKEFTEKFPAVWQRLRSLEGKINAHQMRELNALVDLDHRSFSFAADHFFNTIDRRVGSDKINSLLSPETLQSIGMRTGQHLYLVGMALMFSILFGIPLGIFSARHGRLGQAILLLSGIVQTIPSLALLCFLIPLFGIGTLPALVALFLYGLLPIVMGTYNGLISINPDLLEVSRALGLSDFQRLTLIELPLGSRSIIGGVRTSAIISIGTATLAALIGAGGYGAPIITGLALNDLHIILQGAIPAAALALLLHGVFEIVNRLLIPKALQRV